MEEDASVGDEGQIEVKSQRKILVGALTVGRLYTRQ
jgi:hypothetical protein